MASRGPPKAPSSPGSAVAGGSPLGSPQSRRQAGALAQAANLSLSGPQGAVFQKLDVLLRDSTDQRQRDFGAKLATDLSNTLQSAAHCREEAESMAWCEDLQAVVDNDHVDAKRLFAELDTMVRKKDLSSLPKGERFENFESEIKGLVRKVASESDLLARQYPMEELTAAPFKCDDEAGGKSADSKAEPVVDRPAPRLFEELCPLLDVKGDALEEDHRHHAAVLAERMTSFVGGIQKKHEETHHFVERLIKGEGSDGHPVDQQHAAWRRSTLLTLQRGMTPKKGAQRSRRASAGSTFSLGRGGSSHRLQKSASTSLLASPQQRTPNGGQRVRFAGLSRAATMAP